MFVYKICVLVLDIMSLIVSFAL